jgi:uncharacterized membrane protein YkgB
MRLIFTYFKIQWKRLFVYLSISCIPLLALYEFLPYKIDHLHTAFIAILVCMKLFSNNEYQYRKNLKEIVKIGLQKELKKTPSKQQIIKRENDYVTSRDIMLAISLLGVVIIAIIYNRI